MPVAALFADGRRHDFDHDIAFAQVLALVFPEAQRLAIAIDTQAAPPGLQIEDVAAALMSAI
ncbi:MAG: hypothetical protein GW757_12680 [Alphaproteobacteria bacterium]|nr:hypothetical protein [Alphaproteobacteria bacterium]